MPTLTSRHCPSLFHDSSTPSQITIEVTDVQLAKFRNGLAQDALPELSIDDRERFITGYCAPCWKNDIGDEEDEEDDAPFDPEG